MSDLKNWEASSTTVSLALNPITQTVESMDTNERIGSLESNEGIDNIESIEQFRKERRRLLFNANKNILRGVSNDLRSVIEQFRQVSNDLNKKLKNLVLISLDEEIRETRVQKIIEKKRVLKKVSFDLECNLKLIIDVNENLLDKEIECPVLSDLPSKKVANILSRKIFQKQKMAEKISRIKKLEKMSNGLFTTDYEASIDATKLENKLKAINTWITNNLKTVESIIRLDID